MVSEQISKQTSLLNEVTNAIIDYLPLAEP